MAHFLFIVTVFVQELLEVECGQKTNGESQNCKGQKTSFSNLARSTSAKQH